MRKKDLDKDFMSIKEFAKFVGITVVSLRHYDKQGIFMPAKHGEDFENKYRYYSPLQITTVKMLRVMTEISIPLSVIRELANERSAEKIVKLLSKSKDRVASEIRFLQEVNSVINTFIELLDEGINATENEISVSETPEKRIILGKKNDFQGETGFMREFLRFCNDSYVPKLNTSFPIGGYFEDMESFLNEPSQPTRFFSIDPKGEDRKPAGLYLIGYTRGYYGQTNGLPERMAAFAEKNGLLFSGPVYNIFLSDEISETNPEQYLLQVSVSVTETRRTPFRRLYSRYKHE